MPDKNDKILRENIEFIIPFIIEKILGINFDKTQVLKDKLQITVERETDYFHLRIFSQLRNLQTQTANQINIMALKIDIRKDPFYEKGKLEGKAEGIAEGIEKGIEEKSKKHHPALFF